MGLTNFPNGVSSYGVPVLGGAGGVQTGTSFFVNVLTGTDDPTFGLTPDKPFASIDYAMGKCTDYKGDVIYAMPGHTETIDSASALDCDVAGVSIIGIGNFAGGYYTAKPVINFTAADGTVEIAADGVTIANVTFEAGVASVATAISNTGGAGFRLTNCEFVDEAADKNFLICYSGGNASKSNYLQIDNCFAHCPDTDNTHFVNLSGAPTGVVIRDNILQGDWGVGCVAGTTNVTGVVKNITIARNIIYNAASTADACINLAATATGIVAYNACGGAHATDGINIGDCAGIENYYVQNALDTSGVLEPATA